MRLLKNVLASLGLSLAILSLNSATAAVGNPELGKEYRNLRQAQPTDSGKKIEVIEFFAYYCPHCHALEPLLADWVKKNSDKIVFKRVHVLNPGVEAQLKLYYALEGLGKVEQYHSKVFQAFHVEHNRLMTNEQVAQFVTKVGLDKTSFFNAYNSFGVTMKLNRMERTMADYEIGSWPTLIVDGRLMTSPSMAVSTFRSRPSEDEQNRAVLPVLDWLIAKVQKERGGK
ncbi:thiol:disulfide interchange protein DsbA/DsbL [Undibacterium cyanobacteriorum]|uniref:Thiol:disulfide interchange protein n=1 Tax=Undibacterium cyanobacteriorum TaxID=3073561 RepID=A0ABY9RGG9_9BURK|nr:thiol:disulfide interchange protein DsbA/DsbL [Undibacterium sp. 20NA77.5]WMW79740.1 thiol:disulfide interchange protein DsbA/DsbL [Undibacterium sp. 20NA77.5]